MTISIFTLITFILFFISPAITCSEIIADGAFGTKGALEGPDYLITDDMGRIEGSNLFHSFSEFNLYSNESATFTGPESIENIISRVTGGSESFINGLLKSDIEKADFYFINPSGVIFGENATLDMGGSFHVTTADYLELSDGTRFHAIAPENSLLTTAPPEAFGFLDGNIGEIVVEGSYLNVPDGETISAIGGDITILNGYLHAPGGVIHIGSLSSEGEIAINDFEGEIDYFAEPGDINIIQTSSERLELDEETVGNIDVSGYNGGTIKIFGGNLSLDRGMLSSTTLGGEGAGIFIDIEGEVLMVHSGSISTVSEEGEAGDISINAGSLLISGSSSIDASTTKNYFTSATGNAGGGDIYLDIDDLIDLRGEIVNMTHDGDGGSIYINASHIIMTGSSMLDAVTYGEGHSGDIYIVTNDLSMTGAAEIGTGSQVAASGDAGDLSIIASDYIHLYAPSGNGFPPGIYTATFSSGDAGDMYISTSHLILEESTMLGSNVYWNGNAGDILIEVHDLDITGGAWITSGTSFTYSRNYDKATGTGGNLIINASGTVNISGYNDENFSSGLYSGAGALGDGGDIIVKAEEIHLTDKGIISSTATGQGKAGNIIIDAGEKLTGKSSIIATSSTESSGGNINIKTDDLILTNNSTVTSSVASGEGGGGNVTIDTDTITALDNSDITANADQGYGGDITIDSVALFFSEDSNLNASSNISGQEGEIEINSPVIDISGYLTILPETFIDVSELLPAQCSARRLEDISSFIIKGRDALPAVPYRLMESR